jgi:hypothetical protein
MYESFKVNTQRKVHKRSHWPLMVVEACHQDQTSGFDQSIEAVPEKGRKNSFDEEMRERYRV